MSGRMDTEDAGRILLAMLGGAALGALVIALTTPKTGREFRASLKSLARRFRGREDMLDEADAEPVEALFI